MPLLACICQPDVFVREGRCMCSFQRMASPLGGGGGSGSGGADVRDQRLASGAGSRLAAQLEFVYKGDAQDDAFARKPFALAGIAGIRTILDSDVRGTPVSRYSYMERTPTPNVGGDISMRTQPNAVLLQQSSTTGKGGGAAKSVRGSAGSAGSAQGGQGGGDSGGGGGGGGERHGSPGTSPRTPGSLDTPKSPRPARAKVREAGLDTDKDKNAAAVRQRWKEERSTQKKALQAIKAQKRVSAVLEATAERMRTTNAKRELFVSILAPPPTGHTFSKVLPCHFVNVLGH